MIDIIQNYAKKEGGATYEEEIGVLYTGVCTGDYHSDSLRRKKSS